jgi:hypothetical protein
MYVFHFLETAKTASVISWVTGCKAIAKSPADFQTA